MSNSKTPKAVATKARERIERAQEHIGDADRELESVAQRDHGAARARVSLWQALWELVQVPGMRADSSENGNGNGHTGE